MRGARTQSRTEQRRKLEFVMSVRSFFCVLLTIPCAILMWWKPRILAKADRRVALLLFLPPCDSFVVGHRWF